MNKFQNKYQPNQPLMNERIRVPEVRLISETGEMLGVMPTRDAIKIARDRGYDLVLVSGGKDDEPPVTKVMNYGKYKFEIEKKAKEAKKKQHTSQLKEIKMRYKIDTHDYLVNVRKAERFLTSGDKVKVSIPLFGREMEHKELAMDLIQKFVTDISEWGLPEKAPKKEGRSFLVIFAPKPQSKPSSKQKEKPKE